MAAKINKIRFNVNNEKVTLLVYSREIKKAFIEESKELISKLINSEAKPKRLHNGKHEAFDLAYRLRLVFTKGNTTHFHLMPHSMYDDFVCKK